MLVRKKMQILPSQSIKVEGAVGAAMCCASKKHGSIKSSKSRYCQIYFPRTGPAKLQAYTCEIHSGALSKIFLTKQTII